MVGLLLKMRWLGAVVAVFGMLNAIAFIVIGAVGAFEGYRVVLAGPPWSEDHPPGVVLAHSIDAFLISMVFFVFALGVTTLFLAPADGRGLEKIPAWMQVHDLVELKFLIWEAILATLVVASIERFVTDVRAFGWDALVLPSAVLLLAAGLFLARKAR